MIPLWKKQLNNSQIKKLISLSLEKKNISEGLITKKVEVNISKFLNVKYCTMLPSGTTALLVGMMALGLKKDDLILIPERSWISVLNAAAILGLKIKTIDVKKNSPVMDEKELLKVKTKPKAIVVVHMGGRAANMKMIKSFAKKKNIKVIEDAAQAFGSKYMNKNLGTLSDVGCFSLSMAKTLTSGQGGFIVTNNKNMWSSIKKIKNNGLENILKIKKYGNLGLNFKFTDISSCILLSELKNVKSYKKKMISLYNHYTKNIINSKKFFILPSNIANGELPQYVEAICIERKKFIKYMEKNNIQCREYYPSVGNSRYASQIRKKLINDNFFSKNGVFLPSGPHQNIKDINKVIKTINIFIEKYLN